MNDRASGAPEPRSDECDAAASEAPAAHPEPYRWRISDEYETMPRQPVGTRRTWEEIGTGLAVVVVAALLLLGLGALGVVLWLGWQG